MSFAQIGKDERRVNARFAQRMAGGRRAGGGDRSGRAGKEFVDQSDSARRSGFENAAEKFALEGRDGASGRMGETRRIRSARAADKRRRQLVVAQADFAFDGSCRIRKSNR